MEPKIGPVDSEAGATFPVHFIFYTRDGDIVTATYQSTWMCSCVPQADAVIFDASGKRHIVRSGAPSMFASASGKNGQLQAMVPVVHAELLGS